MHGVRSTKPCKCTDMHSVCLHGYQGTSSLTLSIYTAHDHLDMKPLK